MKKLTVMMLFLCMISAAFGEVSARICLPDGNTMSEPAEIMVGTTLSIVVDANDLDDPDDWIGDPNDWIGALALMDANSNYSVLYGRDCDDANCPNSCLPAAGMYPLAEFWQESSVDGFNLYAGLIYAEAGDWFVIDYNAVEIGDCKVGFYTHVPYMESIFNRYLEFTHVRTRDFNGNRIVDFGDFAIFSSYWLHTGYSDPSQCEGTDLDADGDIDFKDYSLFADYWLEYLDKRWWPE